MDSIVGMICEAILSIISLIYAHQRLSPLGITVEKGRHTMLEDWIVSFYMKL